MWSHQSPRWASAGSSGSQCACFLNTNDHFLSSWTSSVRGGKSHELVVELPGVLADDSAVADHRVAVHAEAPGRGPHPVAVGQVADQVDGLVLGQTGAEQGRPLPLGEAG